MKTNREQKISASDGTSLSDMFCFIYVMQICKTFDRTASATTARDIMEGNKLFCIPGRSGTPGTLKFLTTYDHFVLNLFQHKTSQYDHECFNRKSSRTTISCEDPWLFGNLRGICMHAAIQGSSQRTRCIRAKVPFKSNKDTAGIQKNSSNTNVKIVFFHGFQKSLARSGSTEHDKFCQSFEIVVQDETINPRQMDVCNILEPWRKVVAIDEDELVVILCS